MQQLASNDNVVVKLSGQGTFIRRKLWTDYTSLFEAYSGALATTDQKMRAMRCSAALQVACTGLADGARLRARASVWLGISCRFGAV